MGKLSGLFKKDLMPITLTDMRLTRLVACLALLASVQALAQNTPQESEAVDLIAFKAPPRTVKDVLKAVESSRADPSAVAKAKEVVAHPVPQTSNKEELHNFYRQRADAYQKLGQIDKALADLRLASTEFASDSLRSQIDSLHDLGIWETRGGNLKNAIVAFESAREKISKEVFGYFMSNNRYLVGAYAQSGNYQASEAALRDAETRMKQLAKSPNYATNGKIWESDLDAARALNAIYQGRWADAEKYERSSIRDRQIALDRFLAEAKKQGTLDTANTQRTVKNLTQFKIARLLELSQAIQMQGRLVEAEIQAREALDLTLKVFDRTSVESAMALNRLARVVGEQGRAADAVSLAKEAMKTLKDSGVSEDSIGYISGRKALGSLLVADHQYREADKVFTQMRNSIVESVKKGGKSIPTADIDWVIALLKIDKSREASEMIGAMLAANAKMANVSAQRMNILSGFNAMATHAMGKVDEAKQMYATLMPALIEQMRSEAENQSTNGRQQERMAMLLEDNISLLAKFSKSQPEKATQYATEAFMLADLARGSSVQRALSASAARANITDQKLAELARNEQDAQRRAAALEEVLSGLMSAPTDQQMPEIQDKLKQEIAALKNDRKKFKTEIEQKFPDYAELVNPKPATSERTRQLLKADEVLVSWYFSSKEGFVWAITQDKPIEFKRIDLSREKMASQVVKLRKALDAGVATIDDIPAFDVNLANSLYVSILEPVKGSLAGKKVMLTAPHAELGQLPLALLTTSKDVKPHRPKGGDFTDYRATNWLIKEISVAQLPSVTALAALRNLPEPSNNRRAFIGFGDPFFSVEQAKIAANKAARLAAANAETPLSLRNVPKTADISSAELALLPRLPDTKEEILEIGKALKADPTQDIFLNKDANVSKVMSTDLSNRRVVMFATHGLIPGELDGLTQPALAMTAPEVSGETKGDGLLTMDKILTLKLNADWVVLSACNTAAGDGSGAEAVSGLGRSFFFAGARALLVSNWPVDSQAARLLMTDMFKRQQDTPGLNKAEYLRGAITNMIESVGAKDDKGRMKYAYAHPLFWAPFVMVGD